MPVHPWQVDHHAREDWIDEVLAESFPASDPPPWTPSTATLSLSPPDRPDAGGTLTSTLKPGDILPHFTVTDLNGRRVDYSSFWQRKNLVLVMLPDAGSSSRSYAEQLMAVARDSTKDDTEWLITRDCIAGMPNPGAVIADRWGELVNIADAPDVAHLPAPEDLVEWMTYVRHRCPSPSPPALTTRQRR